MNTIAFLGLGNMGRGMAARLLAAGHSLHVYNRTAAKAVEFARLGARGFATPRAACEGVDAVFAMVSDDVASREVWTGPDGALAASLVPQAFAIECSTLSHAWVLELAGLAGARNLRYLDAPVTGLPDAAAAGELTLLVGARALDLESAAGLLAPVSNRVLHFGAVGAGTAYKLIVNLLGAVQIASAAESMALAERAGLRLPQVAEALALSQAASPQVVRNTRRMVAGDHARNIVFTPALRLKDVDYALQLAQSLGVGAPFGDVAAESFRRLTQQGFAELNESCVIEVARRRLS